MRACAASDCGSLFSPARINSRHCSARCRDRDRDRLRRKNPVYRTERAEYFARYQALNREKIKAKSAKWNAANRERHRLASLEWWRAHKHSTPHSWRRDHPVEAAEKERLRTKRLRLATPYPLNHADVVSKMTYWGDRCWMCDGPFEAIDHVKPISRGGLNILANLRPACTSCNSRKRDNWFGPQALSMFFRQ